MFLRLILDILLTFETGRLFLDPIRRVGGDSIYSSLQAELQAIAPNSGLLHWFKPLHVGVEHHQWPHRRPAFRMHRRHKSGLDTFVRTDSLSFGASERSS